MKVLGKWPEKLFLLDTPFEVTRTTELDVSAEDSSCVSPFCGRKGTKKHTAPAGTLLGSLCLPQAMPGLSGSKKGTALPLCLPWSSWLPALQLGAENGRLASVPRKVQ